jgi:integrase/recombinase XerD
VACKKNGGPLWSRTTDLSLIRNGASRSTAPDSYYSTHAEYIELWKSDLELKGISKLTIASYRQKVEALLGEYVKPIEFNIKRYLTRKQELGSCSGTIANYIKAYRSFFGYLFERGLYNFNPSCLKLPKIRHKERRVPSDEDVSKLLSVVHNTKDKVALLLLVDTGIRVTELASIKLKNIDFDDASIIINGKGSKVRTVYLSETTVKYLRKYVKTIKSEYLFPSTRADAKGYYRNRTFFEKRLREWCKQVGIERITPHQLRHYFATYTLSRGGDIKAVSQMLGHADVGITLKIYHHVSAMAIKDMHCRYSPLKALKTVSAIA